MDLSLKTESFTQDRRNWLGSAHGTDAPVSVTLDVSKFTANTHYPDGYIKSGIPLGKVTATSLYGPYDNAASDGRETCVGFLFTAQDVNARGVASTKVVGSMLLHCFIREAKLPVSIDAAGKTDLGARVIFV
ncbi:head decoration protein [Streptomyces scabiei]|uniref:head decoration protein n=1 Tax=Streptomyces scabiei TaxID=1930 RepID=UPI0029BD7961|nr:head decoration protein [Streptomyces scabiei]MDX2575890.1 head decoration protein [Streptomyces scabiei]MDX2885637.1 head decoration protein [Streptomyces scabiei]MDX2997643.1 head decoration protein [Streptomyces scabiei]MDX3032936.1 head decoration protein [Streptomyces scabiei]MDX3051277.1 head decoration protein [Streptomyces scabiei]